MKITLGLLLAIPLTTYASENETQLPRETLSRQEYQDAVATATKNERAAIDILVKDERALEDSILHDKKKSPQARESAVKKIRAEHLAKRNAVRLKYRLRLRVLHSRE